ncbi:MAG TPA: hypothetical protein V6C97_34625 [Oculatellaceae cyanobacterium]
MFKRKKYIRLDEIQGMPKLADLKRLLFESNRARGSTVEQPWRSEKTKLRYSITVCFEVDRLEPIWSLYQGEGAQSRHIWTQSFRDPALLNDVIALSLPAEQALDTLEESIRVSDRDKHWNPKLDRREHTYSTQEVELLSEPPDTTPPKKPSGVDAFYSLPPIEESTQSEEVAAAAGESGDHRNREAVKDSNGRSDLYGPGGQEETPALAAHQQEHESAPEAAPPAYPPGQQPYPPGYPPPYPGYPPPPYGYPPVDPAVYGGYPPPYPGYPPGYPPYPPPDPSLYPQGYPPQYPPGYQPYPPGYPAPAGYPPQYPPYPPAPGAQPGQNTARMSADSDLIAKRPNILLGDFLVETGLIPESTLEAALQLQGMVRNGTLSTSQAAEAVKRAHNRGGEVEQFTPTELPPDASPAKVNAPPLGEILVEAGLIRVSILKAALNLQDVVRTGALSKEEAVNAFIKEHFGKAGQDSLESARDQKVLRLFVKAKLISQGDIDAAEAVRKKHGGDVAKILEAAGKFDRQTFEAAQVCQNLVDENRLKIEQAIIALHYCQRSRVSFDDAIEELGWEKP